MLFPRNRFNRMSPFDLMDELMARPAASRRDCTFAINVKEDEDKATVFASLPGFSKDEVKLEVQNNILSIVATHKEESEEEQKDYLQQEFCVCNLERQIPLGEAIDVEKINATMENGVLTVELPKKEAVKPRAIDVKVK